MDGDRIAAAVAASSLSELCWVDGSGLPQVRGVVALVRQGRPALAFTYADELVAREVAAAARVGLSLREGRSTGRAFQPLTLAGSPRLVEDPTGDLYVAELLKQEVHRYPPARLFADSPLLMREHWWFLPRLVVELDVDTVTPVSRRASRYDHLLVVADGVADGVAPVVAAGGVGHLAGDRLEVDVEGPAPPVGPAVLFGHDASFPDLERWSQWRYRGHWDGTALTVEELPSRVGLGPTPGLLQRWRRQRALERSCIAALPRS